MSHEYVCSDCGASGCKLWRAYQVHRTRLLCVSCVAKDQKKSIEGLDDKGTIPQNKENVRTNVIGWFFPSIQDKTTGCKCIESDIDQDDFCTHCGMRAANPENFGEFWNLISIPREDEEAWENLPNFI